MFIWRTLLIIITILIIILMFEIISKSLTWYILYNHVKNVVWEKVLVQSSWRFTRFSFHLGPHGGESQQKKKKKKEQEEGAFGQHCWLYSTHM